jgi:hypothetical protein
MFLVLSHSLKSEISIRFLPVKPTHTVIDGSETITQELYHREVRCQLLNRCEFMAVCFFGARITRHEILDRSTIYFVAGGFRA